MYLLTLLAARILYIYVEIVEHLPLLFEAPTRKIDASVLPAWLVFSRRESVQRCLGRRPSCWEIASMGLGAVLAPNILAKIL